MHPSSGPYVRTVIVTLEIHSWSDAVLTCGHYELFKTDITIVEGHEQGEKLIFYHLEMEI